MKNKLFISVFLFLILIFTSCDSYSDGTSALLTDSCEEVKRTPDSLRYFPNYDKPIITFPNKSIDSVFYSDEVVEIKWELQNNLGNTELQILEFQNPFNCLDYEDFHLLNNNPTIGYGNQFVHYFHLNQYSGTITDSVYVAYRIRATDIGSPQKYSLWTDVNTFTMVPLVNLKKEIIVVSYNFNFMTEEVNEFYYSGALEKNDYKLNDIANENNLNFDKIRFVRPVKFETNFITKDENNQNPFSRIMIGFDEDFEYNKEHYPFEIFADVYPGSFEESPVRGTLYKTNQGNFFSEINNYDLKVLYKLEETSGKQHEFTIDLTYEIFSDY